MQGAGFLGAAAALPARCPPPRNEHGGVEKGAEMAASEGFGSGGGWGSVHAASPCVGSFTALGGVMCKNKIAPNRKIKGNFPHSVLPPQRGAGP